MQKIQHLKIKQWLLDLYDFGIDYIPLYYVLTEKNIRF